MPFSYPWLGFRPMSTSAQESLGPSWLRIKCHVVLWKRTQTYKKMHFGCFWKCGTPDFNDLIMFIPMMQPWAPTRPRTPRSSSTKSTKSLREALMRNQLNYKMMHQYTSYLYIYIYIHIHILILSPIEVYCWNTPMVSRMSIYGMHPAAARSTTRLHSSKPYTGIWPPNHCSNMIRVTSTHVTCQ